MILSCATGVYVRELALGKILVPRPVGWSALVHIPHPVSFNSVIQVRMTGPRKEFLLYQFK